MAGIRAEEELARPVRRSPEEIKRLVQAATGSETAGEDAWAKAALQEMRQQG